MLDHRAGFEYKKLEDFMQALNRKPNPITDIYFEVLNSDKEIPVKVTVPKEPPESEPIPNKPEPNKKPTKDKDIKEPEPEVIETVGIYRVSTIILTAVSQDYRQQFVYREIAGEEVIVTEENKSKAESVVLARMQAIINDFSRFFGGAQLKNGRAWLV